VPYIIPEFEHYIETPFSPTSDNFFNCDVHRPSEDAPVDERMIFVNHNLNKKLLGDVLVPDQGAAADTNSEGNILQQTDICVEKHGRNPNVVMVSTLSFTSPFTPFTSVKGVMADVLDSWTSSPRAMSSESRTCLTGCRRGFGCNKLLETVYSTRQESTHTTI
jgi:hypothetical protein